MTMQSCWLSPSGQVTYCDFAEHSKTADILLQKLKPELLTHTICQLVLRMTQLQNLSNYATFDITAVEGTTKCTKAQREAMFDLTRHWHEQ